MGSIPLYLHLTPQVSDLRCSRFQYKRSLGATLGAALGATLEPYSIVDSALSGEPKVPSFNLASQTNNVQVRWCFLKAPSGLLLRRGPEWRPERLRCHMLARSSG